MRGGKTSSWIGFETYAGRATFCQESRSQQDFIQIALPQHNSSKSFFSSSIPSLTVMYDHHRFKKFRLISRPCVMTHRSSTGTITMSIRPHTDRYLQIRPRKRGFWPRGSGRHGRKISSSPVSLPKNRSLQSRCDDSSPMRGR